MTSVIAVGTKTRKVKARQRHVRYRNELYIPYSLRRSMGCCVIIWNMGLIDLSSGSWVCVHGVLPGLGH